MEGLAFSSLDPLVLGNIISKSTWQTRLALERTCRQVCTLARGLQPLCIHLRGDEGALFCRVPPQRAFRGCTSLSYIMTSTGSSLLSMTAAMGYAAMYCHELAHVKLMFEVPANARAAVAQHGWTTDMKMALEETCLVGALSALQLMPALRKLELMPLWFSRVTCQSMAMLTGLTYLRLGVPTYVADSYMYGDLSALAGLTGLQQLILDDLRMLPAPAAGGAAGVHSAAASPAAAASSPAAGSTAAAAAGGSGATWFPSGLKELHLAQRLGTHLWLPHVQACSGLRKLVVSYPGKCYTWQAHPTVVIQAVSSSLQQLSHLEFQGGDNGVDWDLEGADDEVHAQVAGPGISSELLVPVAALSDLSHLEALHTSGSLRLAVTCDAHWQHLAACTRLRSLEQLQAFCVPPEDLELTTLTRVFCLVNGPVTPVYELLHRCPALVSFEMDYDISPIFEGWRNQLPACCHQLEATLRFRVEHVYILTALLTQLQTCRSLDLLWSLGDRLPDLGSMPSLQRLVLRWQPGTNNAPPKQVYPEDVLHMLHGCKALRELEVHQVHFMTARYALMLQYQHPHLRLLKLVGCGALEAGSTGPSDPDRLMRVQQLLRPGLRVVEEPRLSRTSSSSSSFALRGD